MEARWGVLPVSVAGRALYVIFSTRSAIELLPNICQVYVPEYIVSTTMQSSEPRLAASPQRCSSAQKMLKRSSVHRSSVLAESGLGGEENAPGRSPMILIQDLPALGGGGDVRLVVREAVADGGLLECLTEVDAVVEDGAVRADVSAVGGDAIAPVVGARRGDMRMRQK